MPFQRAKLGRWSIAGDDRYFVTYLFLLIGQVIFLIVMPRQIPLHDMGDFHLYLVLGAHDRKIPFD
jgi:hypothetical protein